MFDDLPAITETLHPARPSVIPSVTATSPVLGFREALEEFGQEDVLDSGKLATRRAYGHALRALGRANPNIVALDGDTCLLYTSPSPRDRTRSRMPSSA